MFFLCGERQSQKGQRSQKNQKNQKSQRGTEREDGRRK